MLQCHHQVLEIWISIEWFRIILYHFQKGWKAKRIVNERITNIKWLWGEFLSIEPEIFQIFQNFQNFIFNWFPQNDFYFSRRCWADKEQQDRRKRNSRPSTRLTPWYNLFFVVPPEEYPSDTEGVQTDDNKAFLVTKVHRQKFLDETMTDAFIRK